MHTNAIPRWGQWLAGGVLLAIAIAAGATGMKINVAHGLEIRTEAGILYGLADLTKIVLPIVCGIVGWTLQTRLVAIACVATSLFCAVTAFNGGADQRLASKQHGADQYTAARAAVASVEAQVASLDAQAAQEARNGGCGKQCRFLMEQAGGARQRLSEARAALVSATPVAVSENAKLNSRISSVLFLVLIEALVWMSVPAMQLLSRTEAKPKVKAKRVPGKSRNAAKPRRKTDRQVAELKKIATQAFLPPRVTKQGRPDRRYKATRLTNDNTVDA